MRSVAFLRGINVGGHRVTKNELIEVFVSCGYEQVDTFLASGNVLFASGFASDQPPYRAVAEQLAVALETALGYAVPTTIRSRSEVEELAAAEPFDADALEASTGKPQVMLLFEEPSSSASREVLALGSDDDLLVLGDRALHWLPSGGMSESELDLGRIEQLIGTNTIRTANTIRRLVAKL
ncbi:MAG: DUF1697 domain-containing protein [Acidimicrobiia bacterium]|nr:DUF1697 domain-containing protein [Acidimicrobiia bacterium]